MKNDIYKNCPYRTGLGRTCTEYDLSCDEHPECRRKKLECLTVAVLIQELQKVENKDLPVSIWSAKDDELLSYVYDVNRSLPDRVDIEY